MRVCIIGTGYVGLSTGVCLAYLGHEVQCLDIDEQKIADLRKGNLPIYEPGLEELFLERKSLNFTSEPAVAMRDAEVIFITVGTPSLPDGHPDLRHIYAAAEMAGKHLGEGFTVVVGKSTIPIGTNRQIEKIMRDAFRESHPGRPEEGFAVASNPEFLRQGSAIHDSLYPDRIVLGSDSQEALERLEILYHPIIHQQFEPPSFLPRPASCGKVAVVTTDLATAEIIKYAANAFLAVKISFANELAEFTEVINADIVQVIMGAGLDRRIGTQFLQAGLGWGGSCFGKDTAALVAASREQGLDMSIIAAARHVNYSQRERMVAKLVRELGTVQGKTVGLLGLAFKPQTDDLRDAPALDIARRLLNRGVCVRAHDPVAMNRARREGLASGIQLCNSAKDLAKGADALILVTEWPEYLSLPWGKLASSMGNPLILDGRNFLDRDELMSAGFRYLGVGRADTSPQRQLINALPNPSLEEAILSRQLVPLR